MLQNIAFYETFSQNKFFLKDGFPKGSHKKTVFFYFRSKGGRGDLGQSKKSLSENTQIFLTKGEGGSHPIQKGFIRFFGHNLPKMGVSYEKTGSFFWSKGGQKRERGRVSVF